MVLEKTVESPLDCKEIQPVHSKGDQAKAGAPLKETVSPSSVTLTCSVPHTHPIGTKSQLAKQMGGLQNSVITESKRLGVELVVVVHSLSHV